MTLNPWFLLILLIGLFGGGLYAYEEGVKHGKLIQSAADTMAIKVVNDKIDANKVEANTLLQNSLNDVIALQTERDQLRTKLLKEHQNNVQTTNKLHAAYAAYSLRFTAENVGSGSGGAGKVSDKTGTASNTASTVIQLPDQIAKNLHELAYDCDSLNDDYKLLYNAVHSP